MRWHYRDPALAWLLPLAYAFHVVEEWFGGFPEWLALIVGSALPRTAFIVINAVAMLAMIAVTRASTAREQYGWAGVAIATVLIVNAFAHAFGSIVTRSYSPGLVTAVIFYIPLAQLVLMRAWLQASRPNFTTGVLVGIAAHALVFAVAYSSAVVD